MPVRRRYIRIVAERLLSAHGVAGPPVHPREIAESLGVRVSYEPAENDLSGFLLHEPLRQLAVIGVNSTHPPKRQRFTLAHELGHYLLHRQHAMHVDRGSAGFKLRSLTSSTGTDEDEVEANIFAAELLMPARFLAKDLAGTNVVELLDDNGDSSQLKRLADRYDVSVRALTFRLANLNFIRL